MVALGNNSKIHQNDAVLLDFRGSRFYQRMFVTLERDASLIPKIQSAGVNYFLRKLFRALVIPVLQSTLS